MGWYGQDFSTDYGHKTPKQIRDEEMTRETETTRWRVLRSAWINFREYYAAIEILDKATGTVTVYGGMDLLEVRKEGRYGRMLWHKPMGESSGPNYYNCPASILDLLTDPAPNEYAREWREKCRETKAAKKRTTGLKRGDKVTFRTPYADSLTWYVGGFNRGNKRCPLFSRTPDTEGYFRLKGWSTRVAAVEAA